MNSLSSHLNESESKFSFLDLPLEILENIIYNEHAFPAVHVLLRETCTSLKSICTFERMCEYKAARGDSVRIKGDKSRKTASHSRANPHRNRDHLKILWLDKNGKEHCEFGPAIITRDAEIWAKHGDYHRAGNKPAGLELMRSAKATWARVIFYKDNLIHRDDGPAVISSSKLQWVKEGVLIDTQAINLIEFYRVFLYILTLPLPG